VSRGPGRAPRRHEQSAGRPDATGEARRASRLFVAVWLPEAILDLIERLERPQRPGVRWTTRDQWHVTLRFVGNAEPDTLVEALHGVFEAPPNVTLGPSVTRLGSRVIVPASGLDGLAAAVVEATDGLGRPPDPRPFVGHVTLARLKNRASCPLVGAPVNGTFTASAISLVASETRADGARYTELARIPLRRP
jgi:2'-5' RNA ligase